MCTHRVPLNQAIRSLTGYTREMDDAILAYVYIVAAFCLSQPNPAGVILAQVYRHVYKKKLR